MNKEKKYDYIFLGSSRVEFHVDTDFIKEKIGGVSLNLGISGQYLPETFLLLKLLHQQNITAKKYFIQIDVSDLSLVNKKSFIGASYFMPFIKEPVIDHHLKKYDDSYFLDSNLPFYRYMNYSYKINYRELFLKINKKNRKEAFFIGLNAVHKNEKSTYLFKERYENALLNEMQIFAQKNNLEIIFYTSPYYNPKNTLSFKEFAIENDIKNYVDSVKRVEYFKDSHHLNYLGARIFTSKLIRDFNLKH
jgi:hypothetical protein